MRDYRLYLDESGTHIYPSIEGHAHRYLGITGVFFENQYYKSTFVPSLEKLKRDFSQPILMKIPWSCTGKS